MMANFVGGLNILFENYVAVGFVVGIAAVIVFVIIAIADEEIEDLDGMLISAFLALVIGLVFGAGWGLVVFVLPFMFLFVTIFLGKRIFYKRVGAFDTWERRNLIRDNFIYRYIQIDRRTGAENF